MDARAANDDAYPTALQAYAYALWRPTAREARAIYSKLMAMAETTGMFF